MRAVENLMRSGCLRAGAAAAAAYLAGFSGGAAGEAGGSERAAGVEFFSEGYDGGWAAAWTDNADDIDFMVVNSGALEFHLPLTDGAAYLERPFTAGNARVSFAVKNPMPGGAPALYLAWDRETWCKAGIMADKSKAEFYGAYMLGGRLVEMRGPAAALRASGSWRIRQERINEVRA